MKLTVRTLSRALSRTLPTQALGLFREDLVTAQRRDPAATSALEIALTYPGVHALWTHRVSHARARPVVSGPRCHRRRHPP